ncbi:MAG: mercury resistance system periplasmic binding protein MerP [Burkholderiales bacterium]|nr:MAG: mercury resistance system periplasmic binding protein MerP [Burkholderiales bacterium]
MVLLTRKATTVLRSFLLGLAIVAAMPVSAAPRTVTLSVPGMDCALCPITVKMALASVPGVSSAEVSLELRRATVTFDDERTSVEALMRATRDAGYPSAPAEPKP